MLNDRPLQGGTEFPGLGLPQCGFSAHVGTTCAGPRII